MSDDTDKDGEGQPDEYLVKHDGEVIGEVEAETEYEAEQKAHDLILSEVWVERVDGAVENRVDSGGRVSADVGGDSASGPSSNDAGGSARSTDAPSADEGYGPPHHCSRCGNPIRACVCTDADGVDGQEPAEFGCPNCASGSLSIYMGGDRKCRICGWEGHKDELQPLFTGRQRVELLDERIRHHAETISELDMEEDKKVAGYHKAALDELMELREQIIGEAVPEWFDAVIHGEAAEREVDGQ